MNYAMILAAGVGQRMRNGGLPKQFLKLMGKPIIIYTLEKFQQSEAIDQMIIVCHGGYVEYMQNLLDLYKIDKGCRIIVGGTDRQNSVKKGLECIREMSQSSEDIVVIHDGVRPLVSQMTIAENVRMAKEHGSAMTVHPVTESVVVTENDSVSMENFKKRSDTYSLTSPQTFRLDLIQKAYEKLKDSSKKELPLLDAAMVYASEGGKVKLVKEQGLNPKITTPEDFYFLKAIIELEENKYIFGL